MQGRSHWQVTPVEGVGELSVVLEQAVGDARLSSYFFFLTFHR
jgi:hypothetical protein